MIAVFSSNKSFELIYKTLLNSDFKVGLLITESPKKSGRGLQIHRNPAHEFASQNNLEILSPEKINDEFIQELAEKIKKNKIEIGLISSYGKILPEKLLKIFPKGVLNIHPSLLPKYRGPAPIVTPILNGESKSGYSIILTGAGCDDGPVVTQGEVEIAPNETQTSLRSKIFAELLPKLPQILGRYTAEKLLPVEQNENLATFTQKIKKNDGLLDEKIDAKTADRKIRAFDEWPKTYFIIGRRRFIVCQATLKDNFLEIKSIQPEGKKPMSVKDFTNGYGNLLTSFPYYVKFSISKSS